MTSQNASANQSNPADQGVPEDNFGNVHLARLVDYLRQRPSATLASGEGALLLAEIDRLHAAELDGMDHYTDARNEIDRLRAIVGALLSGFERRGLLPEGRTPLAEEALEAVAQVFERLERAERILAALREPSEGMMQSALKEYGPGQFVAFHRTRLIDAIRAAVAAAEQEVGS